MPEPQQKERNNAGFARGFLLGTRRDRWVKKEAPEMASSDEATPPHSPEITSSAPPPDPVPHDVDDWLVGLAGVPAEKAKKKQDGRKGHRNDEQHSEPTTLPSPLASAPSLTRSARKRAKRKGSAAAAAATTEATEATAKPARSFRFGSVRLLEVPRDVGGDGVPSDGTWALSLAGGDSTAPVLETRMSVEAHCEWRQHILAARLAAVPKRQRPPSAAAPPLETRQYDFKSGATNPLFHRLSEKARKELLLLDVDGDSTTTASAASMDTDVAPQATVRSVRQTHGHSNGRSNSQTRGGSGHHRHRDQQQQHSQARRGAGRDSSASGDSEGGFGLTSHDLFMERAQADLEVLEALRGSRSASGGCSCHAVKAVDKLPLPKLKEELKARGLPSQGPRRELSKALQAHLDSTGGVLCDKKTCECFRSGIGCHGDVCRCCNVASGKAGGSCSNPFGLYRYEPEQVDRIRLAFVTAQLAPVPS